MSEHKFVICDRCGDASPVDGIGIIRKLAIGPMWFSIKYRLYYKPNSTSYEMCGKDLCSSCAESLTEWFSSVRKSKEVV